MTIDLLRTFEIGWGLCLLYAGYELWQWRSIWFERLPRGLGMAYPVSFPYAIPRRIRSATNIVIRTPSFALIVGIFVAGGTFLFGRYVLAGSAIGWFCMTVLFHRNPMIFHSGDALIRIVMAMLVISSFASTDSVSNNRLLLSKALVGGMYLQASIWKLCSPSWTHFLAIRCVLSDKQYARAWALRQTENSQCASTFATIGNVLVTASIVVMQLAITACVVIPGQEVLALAIIICLHFPILLLMRLGYMTPAVLLAGSLPQLFSTSASSSFANAIMFPIALYLLFGDSRGGCMRFKAWRTLVLLMRWLGLGYTWQMFSEAPDTPQHAWDVSLTDLQDAKEAFRTKGSSLGWIDASGQFKNLQARKFHESMDFAVAGTLREIVKWAKQLN